MPDSEETENKETKVLTLRIPQSLDTRLSQIAKERAVTKTEIVKRYLKLSEIFQIDDKFTKIDSDNQPLILYPSKLIDEVFNLISRISSKDRFDTRLDLGDKLGNYINTIIYNMSIDENDYYSIFKLIEKLGWFKIAYRKVSDESSIILIPKNFGEKSLVYAMVYRIVKHMKHPNEWTEELIDHNMPFKQDKLSRTERDTNDAFEKLYDKHIKKPLEPDLEQEKRDHYYFGALRILSSHT
jgi:hypothetical protein